LPWWPLPPRPRLWGFKPTTVFVDEVDVRTGAAGRSFATGIVQEGGYDKALFQLVTRGHTLELQAHFLVFM
jgi:hypothetical protein